MAAVTVSNVAELSARYLLSLVRAVRDGEHLWRLGLPAGPWVRTVVRLAGFVLAGIGLLLGLGVVWTQLARALPLAALLHHPRALRSMLLTGAGLGLLLVGRLSLRKGGGLVDAPGGWLVERRPPSCALRDGCTSLKPRASPP